MAPASTRCWCRLGASIAAAVGFRCSQRSGCESGTSFRPRGCGCPWCPKGGWGPDRAGHTLTCLCVRVCACVCVCARVWMCVCVCVRAEERGGRVAARPGSARPDGRHQRRHSSRSSSTRHAHTPTASSKQRLKGQPRLHAPHAHQEAATSQDILLNEIAKSLPSSLSSPNSYACVVGGTSQPVCVMKGGVCWWCVFENKRRVLKNKASVGFSLHLPRTARPQGSSLSQRCTHTLKRAP